MDPPFADQRQATAGRITDDGDGDAAVRARLPVTVITRTIVRRRTAGGVPADVMSRFVLSVVGIAALGGGVAAGLTALVVVAVAWLVVVALANAIRLLGEVLEAVDDGLSRF